MRNQSQTPKDSYFFERSPADRTWFLLLLCLLFLALDHLLIPYSVFPVFFIFPVMLAAWHWRFRHAAVYALVLSLSRFGHHFVTNGSENIVLVVFGSLTRCSVLILLAALTGLVARQTRQLRRRLRALEGMLPVCSFCKAIRDNKGNWVKMEKYIMGHSEATFTHSLCPDCLKEQYGEGVAEKMASETKAA